MYHVSGSQDFFFLTLKFLELNEHGKTNLSYRTLLSFHKSCSLSGMANYNGNTDSVFQEETSGNCISPSAMPTRSKVFGRIMEVGKGDSKMLLNEKNTEFIKLYLSKTYDSCFSIISFE